MLHEQKRDGGWVLMWMIYRKETCLDSRRYGSRALERRSRSKLTLLGSIRRRTAVRHRDLGIQAVAASGIPSVRRVPQAVPHDPVGSHCAGDSQLYHLCVRLRVHLHSSKASNSAMTETTRRTDFEKPAKTWNRELPGTCLNELSFYFGKSVQRRGPSIGRRCADKGKQALLVREWC